MLSQYIYNDSFDSYYNRADKSTELINTGSMCFSPIHQHMSDKNESNQLLSKVLDDQETDKSNKPLTMHYQSYCYKQKHNHSKYKKKKKNKNRKQKLKTKMSKNETGNVCSELLDMYFLFSSGLLAMYFYSVI